MNCDNCGNDVQKENTLNLSILYSSLFYLTCDDCTPICHLCGQDNGYSRNIFVSSNQCDFCTHETCRSCGIHVTCENCSKTACENCIDEGNSNNICYCLKVVLESLRKKSNE